MGGIYLLDTNTAVALLNKSPQVREVIARSDEIHISAIAIGELYFGAEKSGRVEINRQRVDEIAENYSVLTCDAQTAHLYGVAKHNLRTKGKPIPENDLWIAATALQHDLILLSRDAHFQAVDGLIVQGW
jgi:tRNA(fMet)-specific endonuclease VapC